MLAVARMPVPDLRCSRMALRFSGGHRDALCCRWVVGRAGMASGVSVAILLLTMGLIVVGCKSKVECSCQGVGECDK